MAEETKYCKIYETDIPLYRGKFIIILTNDLVAVKEHCPDFEDPEIYGYTIAMNWKGLQGFCVVFNFHNPHRPITHGVIVHEAIHTTSMILNERGVSADHDNDEPFAYLCDWIIDRIYAFIAKNDFKPHIFAD